MSRFFLYFGFWVLAYLISGSLMAILASWMEGFRWADKLGRYSGVTLTVLVTAAIAAGVTLAFDPLR